MPSAAAILMHACWLEPLRPLTRARAGRHRLAAACCTLQHWCGPTRPRTANALAQQPARPPPATCRWGTGPAAAASTRARGCAPRGQAQPPARQHGALLMRGVGRRRRLCGCSARVPAHHLDAPPRSSAAMAPRGPSHRRAVRASRATCRRGAPLDASFGDHARRIKMPRAAPSISGKRQVSN